MGILENIEEATEKRRVKRIAEYLEVILTSKDADEIKASYNRIEYIMDCTRETIDSKWLHLYKTKYRKTKEETAITKFNINSLLEGIKKDIMSKVEGLMVEEDFQDMFEKIKTWLDQNIKSEEDADKFNDDPSALMEELGLYSLDDIFQYMIETFKEDFDMMKGLDQKIKLVIEGRMSVDEVVDSIYPVIKANMEIKEINVPEYLTKLVIKFLILEGKKTKTAIMISNDVKEENVKDAEF